MISYLGIRRPTFKHWLWPLGRSLHLLAWLHTLICKMSLCKSSPDVLTACCESNSMVTILTWFLPRGPQLPRKTDKLCLYQVCCESWQEECGTQWVSKVVECFSSLTLQLGYLGSQPSLIWPAMWTWGKHQHLFNWALASIKYTSRHGICRISPGT